MSFGIYLHTPYCLQRCTYCDFATYEMGTIIPPERYFQLVEHEIRQRAQFFPPAPLHSLYFGGGTPSLVDSEFLRKVVVVLQQEGFELNSNSECTIEINPATVSEKKLNDYLDFGINRFSVGAQTFKDSLLKSVHREHNAQDTLNTLALLRKYNLNFTFDILFGLPGQSPTDLKQDLEIAVQQGAKHISPYCLTVPEGHPLAKIRPPEDEQIEMFELIHNTLLGNGFEQYEISNYARAGFESRHNLLYWQDQPYWGIGLSSHSYSSEGDWGLRFWNPNNIKEYEKQIVAAENTSFKSPRQALSENQFELLERHQALTDFCHTSLRIHAGLDLEQVRFKFGIEIEAQVRAICQKLVQKDVLEGFQYGFRLSRQGQFISNQVFERLTFFSDDIK